MKFVIITCSLNIFLVVLVQHFLAAEGQSTLVTNDKLKKMGDNISRNEGEVAVLMPYQKDPKLRLRKLKKQDRNDGRQHIPKNRRDRTHNVNRFDKANLPLHSSSTIMPPITYPLVINGKEII